MRADAGAAMMFLEGKNRSVTNTLVARMEQAAAQQDYEQAARFRDQIARLKKVEAEQLISEHSSGDLDVVGMASDSRAHCATVLFIRGGEVQGSQNHFPRTGGRNAGTLLSGFRFAVLPRARSARAKSSSKRILTTANCWKQS